MGLMPAKYGTSNELNLISESTGRKSFIDKESTLLRMPQTQLTIHKNSTSEQFSHLRRKSREAQKCLSEKKELFETLGGGGIADFLDRKVTSSELYAKI